MVYASPSRVGMIVEMVEMPSRVETRVEMVEMLPSLLALVRLPAIYGG